jgi:phenylacetaldehyde dehydrogenase
METYDALLASISPASGPTRTILDPVRGEAVGEAPVHTLEYLEGVVAAARAAQPAWAAGRRPVRRAPPRSAVDLEIRAKAVVVRVAVGEGRTAV